MAVTWTDDTIVQSSLGDLVPRLQVLGLDAKVEGLVADAGGAMRARDLLNGVNDWLGTMAMGPINLEVLEGYIGERQALGELDVVEQGDSPSRLAAPAATTITPTHFQWLPVQNADKYLVIGRRGFVLKTAVVNGMSVPLAAVNSQLDIPPDGQANLSVAAVDANGVVGWFATPKLYTNSTT